MKHIITIHQILSQEAIATDNHHMNGFDETLKHCSGFIDVSLFWISKVEKDTYFSQNTAILADSPNQVLDQNRDVKEFNINSRYAPASFNDSTKVYVKEETEVDPLPNKTTVNMIPNQESFPTVYTHMK